MPLELSKLIQLLGRMTDVTLSGIPATQQRGSRLWKKRVAN